jgi:hypothetical protein
VVVVVVVVGGGAGVVIVDCSEEEEVRLSGSEPQPASIAVPAISATPTARRKRDVVAIIVEFLGFE